MSHLTNSVDLVVNFPSLACHVLQRDFGPFTGIRSWPRRWCRLSSRRLFQIFSVLLCKAVRGAMISVPKLVPGLGLAFAKIMIETPETCNQLASSYHY